MSYSLRPHGLQHDMSPCSSPTPGVYSNSCPLSRWCHPTIASSVHWLSNTRFLRLTLLHPFSQDKLNFLNLMTVTHPNWSLVSWTESSNMKTSEIKWSLGLPWWFRGKESACQCRRHRFDPWVKKIPWRRKWQLTLVFLPGKFHEQRSLVGYSP